MNLIANKLFYQNIGKLYYAIAFADKSVNKKEIEALKRIVKSEWLAFDEFNDEFKTDTAYQIEIVFDWLLAKEVHAKKCFNEFIDYAKDHNNVFTDNIKIMITRTAQVIAASFSGVNKSELIMLANLKIEFKRL